MKVEEFIYTGAQLCVAGQLGGYSHLLLPEDPFRGWLVEEISESLQTARRELTQAGVLAAGDGQLTVELKAIVDALGAPEKSLALNYTAGGTVASKLNMHRRDGQWLWLDQLNAEEYQIKFISPEKFPQVAADFLKIEDQGAFSGGPIELGAETLRAARQAARDQGETACKAELKKSGLSAAQMDLLAPILTDPVSSGSILSISWENRIADQQDALAFLEGSEGLYQLTENDDGPGWVCLTPIKAEDIKEKISQVIQVMD